MKPNSHQPKNHFPLFALFRHKPVPNVRILSSTSRLISARARKKPAGCSHPLLFHTNYKYIFHFFFSFEKHFLLGNKVVKQPEAHYHHQRALWFFASFHINSPPVPFSYTHTTQNHIEELRVCCALIGSQLAMVPLARPAHTQENINKCNPVRIARMRTNERYEKERIHGHEYISMLS